MLGSSSDLDFLRSIPPQLILLVIGSGTLYIISMVIIFRRAAKRRRKRREIAGEYVPPYGAEPPAAAAKKRLLGDFGHFIRGELPDKPLRPAEWTVPIELRTIPEPDLDMLTSPVIMDTMETPRGVFAQDTPTSEPVSIAASHGSLQEIDWMAAVVPQEEINPVPAGTTSATPATPDNSDMTDVVEIMRVWRDLNDGSLIIQMGNQRYRSYNDIHSPELARRFSAVVRDLWEMVSGSPLRSTGAMPAVSAGEMGSAEPPKPRMGLLNADTDAVKAAKQPSAARGRGQPAPEAPPGIADAVENFLQAKLSTSPQFAARSVHIRSASDHGVRIEVDGHYYDSIGDVIDADVREFLFSMMREWEARQ